MLIKPAVLTALLPSLVFAATADQWRSRSSYQLITDRFAAPNGDLSTPCNTSAQLYCGGTWETIITRLDYVQSMGYDAIWISPTALNIEGNNGFGEAYHGYWTVDPTKLNPHFGGDSDLKALSAAVHERGMYLMIDLAINDLASLSTDISDSQLASDDNGTLLFKDQSDYHPPCDIDWGNHTSEMDCWLSTSAVTLMDLDQSNPNVANTLINWIPTFVQEYGVDGLRLDASKHQPIDFQHQFCDAAGVFCMGEVAGHDTAYAGTFQDSNGIDSVFGFGLMFAFDACFSGTPQNMSTLQEYIQQAALHYSDPTVIGNFLDNQDNPRINSLTSDKTLVWNAIVGVFLYGGIPTIYYGLEQEMSDGNQDPENREALWLYNDYSTTATESFGRIIVANKIRSTLNADPSWLNSVATVLAIQSQDIALLRGPALIVLTNRGAAGTGTWTISNSTFAAGSTVTNLISCDTAKVGTDSSLSITWTAGQPFVFVDASTLSSTGFCGSANSSAFTNGTIGTSISTSSTTSSTLSSSESGSLAESKTGSPSLSPSATSSSSVSSIESTTALSKLSSTSTGENLAVETSSALTSNPSSKVCRGKSKRHA